MSSSMNAGSKAPGESAGSGFAGCWYWIRKLQARLLAGDYASAIEAASKAQPLALGRRDILF